MMAVWFLSGHHLYMYFCVSRVHPGENMTYIFHIYYIIYYILYKRLYLFCPPPPCIVKRDVNLNNQIVLFECVVLIRKVWIDLATGAGKERGGDGFG